MNERMVDCFYLFANLFRIYVLFRYMALFFDRTRVRRYWEMGAYFLYFSVNSALYLYFSLPFLNLAVNLLCLFLIAFLYPSKLFRKVIAVVGVYGVSIALEQIPYGFLVRQQMIEPPHRAAAYVALISALLLFLAVLIGEKLLKGRSIPQGQGMNTVHWLAILLLPAGSIFICTTLFLTEYHAVLTTVSIGILLLINGATFYLYDVAERYYAERAEHDFLVQQVRTHVHQLEIMASAQEKLQISRHDMKNHMLKMRLLLDEKKEKELGDYLDTALERMTEVRQYVNTGNMTIDSILNYKLQEAVENGAQVKTSMGVPNELPLEDYDLSALLGNLLDNANRALKTSEEKQLQVVMQQDQGSLYIEVGNSYGGSLVFADGIPQTTKENKEYHGMGFRSIQAVVNKYDGVMNLVDDHHYFRVGILFFVK